MVGVAYVGDSGSGQRFAFTFNRPVVDPGDPAFYTIITQDSPFGGQDVDSVVGSVVTVIFSDDSQLNPPTSFAIDGGNDIVFSPAGSLPASSGPVTGV